MKPRFPLGPIFPKRGAVDGTRAAIKTCIEGDYSREVKRNDHSGKSLKIRHCGSRLIETSFVANRPATGRLIRFPVRREKPGATASALCPDRRVAARRPPL